MNNIDINKILKIGKWVWGILLILILIVKLNPFVTINTWERWIVFSKIDWVHQEPLLEWTHLRIPFIEDIFIMNVQSEKMVFSNNKTKYKDAKLLLPRLSAASSDLQDVFVDAVITYHVDPKSVSEVYQKIWVDYPLKKVSPEAINVIKTETAKFKVSDTLKNREVITSKVNEKLTEVLKKSNIILEWVSLTNFDFDPKFKNSIEDKQVAKVNKEKEQIILETVAIKAQQKVKQAEADKEAAIQIAEGKKQAKIKEWEGIKAYNESIKQELTDKLIKYKALENAWKAINKWDGKYPATYMWSTNGIPLVNIK